MNENAGHNFAQVALDVPLLQVFTYRVPERLRDKLAVGKRVRVAFGRRRMTGYCVGLAAETDRDPAKLKDLDGIVDAEPLVGGTLLELTRWMAETYACPWGRVLNEAVPAGVRADTRARKDLYVRRLASPEQLRVRADETGKRAPRRAAALRALADEPDDEVALAALRRKVGNLSRSTVEDEGFTEIIERRFRPDVLAGYRVERTASLHPTPEQLAALKAIAQYVEPPRFGCFLLHGVTGSGKTEVYLQALRRVVDAGRQGIVLVPEISLTPQTIRRFLQRFDRVAVLHSRITDAERREEWRRVREEDPEVVIGARSALFAPVRSLGMIVIDEEHEPSYKQPSAPRYHARDAALERARLENAVVVLGTATPSLESYHAAQEGRCRLLRLPRRVEDRPLPHVEIVDMREARAEARGFVMLGRRLVDAMQRTLERGEQVILLLNRRGFSTYIHCRTCGFVLKCEMCSVSLTYHRAAREARCHSCNRRFPAPQVCPSCRTGNLNYFGAGTQRVEEVVQRLFPKNTVRRMDIDTTSGRDSHREILDAFGAGQIDVLLGTQMIGKGLDFPNVTLVGVVDADTALHLPDFRATERTFQLLTQVAGRTGRSYRGGRVFVQTMQPEHVCIRFAAHHDYQGFAAHELAERQALNYPPFRRLARVVISSRNPRDVPARAEALGQILHKFAGPETEIAGPMEAPVGRLRGWHRWHFILKTPPGDEIPRLLRLCENALRSSGAVRIVVDVDPMTML